MTNHSDGQLNVSSSVPSLEQRHGPVSRRLSELQTFRTQDLSFPRTKGPYGELSFLGPFVPGNFRSHYPIGLVAALLCVLNYCMFGCDFTLMMLTPL